LLAGSQHDHLQRIESKLPKLPPSKAVRQINEALAAEDFPSGFLSAAENTLIVASDDFTAKLGVEAIQVARSRHATAVDRQDVQDADRNLRSSRSLERQGWLLAVAGITGGSAITAAVAILLPQTTSHPRYWWTVISLLSIVSLVLFSIAYPWSQRRSG
jgi:histone H3/H4